MRYSWSLIAYMGCSALAHAGVANIEVYDKTAHRVLAIHEHRGNLYVAGEPQHEYELRIRNHGPHRVLAVTSVDGVNVVTGQTASEDQGGYVIDSYGAVTIDGWRKSLDEVATFYFTSLKDSYAARTGRAKDVGVIGVALFAERTPCCHPTQPMLEAPAAAAEERNSSDLTDKARSSRPAPRRDSQLGTGHGHRQDSPAEYVAFQRATERPVETITIYYDSMRNLVARGVLPADAFADHLPDPFPGRFVPDP
jgi:hypothetical protein